MGNISNGIGNKLVSFVPDRFLLSSVEFYATEEINWADEFIVPLVLVVAVFFVMKVYLVNGKKAYL